MGAKLFANKNIIITGASSGLGKQMAIYAAKNNANLVISSKDNEKLKETKNEIEKTYPNIKIKEIPLDISIKENNKFLVQEANEFLGSIDIFIANAGRSMWCKFSDLGDPDEILDLMKLNFMSVVYAVHFALPFLRKNKGSFLAISSIQGTFPTPYHSGYVASKYSVNGFIDALRMEEPDVHFMLALPAWISGTNIRQNALKSAQNQGVKVNTKHGKNAISAIDCAKIILDALHDKKEQLFIPSKLAIVPLLRIFMRKIVDRMIVKKVNTQLQK